MKNAEGDGFAGREDEAASRHQRRRAGDDREPAPEGPDVKPVAMGKRQRHADQSEERARHDVRQEPHLRRERQHGRGKPKIGEVPAQMVDAHADERQAARAIDRVDAARGVLIRAVIRRLARVPRSRAAASNKASSRMNAPSYSTGPVIRTWSSEPRHSMMRSPPGRRTVPLRSMSPSRDRRD